MSQEKSKAADSEDELLKELGIASDGDDEGTSQPKKKTKKAVADDVEDVKKSSKSKKAKRSRNKAMDGFIVSDDESSSEDEPKKAKKRNVVEAVKPDFEMPDVEAVLNNIFGNSDDEKLAHFSSDEEHFSDLSDIDEGVVPRTKTQIKKWVTYTKKTMKAKKTGAKKSRRGGSDDEVNLGDILPEGTRRKKRPVADSDDEGVAPTPGERVKKDPNKMSEEEVKMKCLAFVEKMDQASFEDNENNKNKKPALKKLTMLEETKQMLLREEWHEHLLNAGVLVVATKWLSPLPDRTLPSVTIRDALIRCLSSFQEITKYMLRESKVAAVVMFLSRNDPEPSIKKSAADLVQQWSRTLSSGTDSWQSLSEVERHRGQNDASRLSTNAQRILSTQMAYGRKIQGAEPSKKVQGPQFASQPLVSTMDYTIRPESKIDVTALVKKSAAPRIFAKQQ